MTVSQSPLVLTKDQTSAIQAILAFKKSEESLLTLGGFAGTGKTTTIVEAVRKMAGKRRPAVAFCAFTGRAASVLKGKLEKVGALTGADYTGTIHGLIYRPILVKGRIVGWGKRESLDFDLVVVDEASMVNEIIFRDLSSYGVPIVAVGDHGQLPPIVGEFNLMADPDVKLEHIHRQAEGDPIIKLSMVVREGGKIPVGQHGEFVSKTTDRRVMDRIPDLSDVMILCGYNKTRVAVNQYVRNRLGYEGPLPLVGERVICLKNNQEAGVYNGMLGTVVSAIEKGNLHLDLSVDMEGGTSFEGMVWRPQFGAEQTVRAANRNQAEDMGDLFDWGYGLTVHKAQGSEAKRVILFEERFSQSTDEYWTRWLYTGVTRARERLLVVGS